MKFKVEIVDFTDTKYTASITLDVCPPMWLNTVTEDHADITTGSELTHCKVLSLSMFSCSSVIFLNTPQ